MVGDLQIEFKPLKKDSKDNFINPQVKLMLETIMSFAALDLNHKAPMFGDDENLDALAAGINMLGEELQAKILQVQNRDLMIREIHHRMKNNLQIVSSILNLQSNSIKDSEIAEKFMNCQERISSMALVHEQLYQSEDMTKLEVNSYFSTLCRRLEHIHSGEDSALFFISATKSLSLSVDQIIPLGLIATELIINSYKHARDRKKVEIKFRLSLKDGHFELEVGDNGEGFENPDDFYNSQSLGLQLVHSLVDQIGAEIEFNQKDPYFVVVKVQV